MFYKKLIISHLLYNFINFITLQTLGKIYLRIKFRQENLSVFQRKLSVLFRHFDRLNISDRLMCRFV
jgi:hypothetical protein